MAIKLETPEERHVQELLLNLTIEDERELRGLGADPEWAIKFSIANSVEAVAISETEGLGAITGVVHTGGLEPLTYPWMLATPVMLLYPKTVWQISQALIHRWQETYPVMSNLVDARHLRAVRWLRRLGAEVEEAKPVPPYNRPYHTFTFRSQPCASLQ